MHVDEMYVLDYIKDTTKAVTEAQDALNVIVDCLKEDYTILVINSTRFKVEKLRKDL